MLYRVVLAVPLPLALGAALLQFFLYVAVTAAPSRAAAAGAAVHGLFFFFCL
jgi:hypothetical protein